MGKRGPKTGSARLTREGRLHYNVDDITGCWNWSRYRNALGYGVLGVPLDRTMLAHRYAWEVYKGVVPAGLCVLHRCDNPSCVNPEHLFLGTQADNNEDMHNKGRGVIPRGETHGCAKLTNKQVQEIREQFGKLSDCELARRYGVTSGAIRHMRLGITWRSVC